MTRDGPDVFDLVRHLVCWHCGDLLSDDPGPPVPAPDPGWLAHPSCPEAHP